MPTVVKCPTCQKPVEWSSAAEFRPFCSERCKLIDLGEWASEKYTIPVKPEIDPQLLDELGYEDVEFFKDPD
ncbi:DNA gyrase inhibitor YacG [Shewanella yunxiaonensis]|uniref:DNA gyrase inhibitor YacG n=1 Tax=Shewanella yunxiaonensis TaxID=2829809 RepID=A0ABX7YTX1_9GAMM|nr:MULTISPECIES: DNA gyrase inhibitor YacG [Shewanella]MDF0535130.1 DNA gyrase inhibitor YacG [Shewanella sp. A32]QUN06147.1 DNA gyrase inhibitor YacG [Shewanella yunxiaonensis]